MYNWNYDPWTFSPYIVEGWQVWRLGLSILCQGNFKPRFIFVVRPTVLNSSSQKRSFSIFKREEFEDIRFVFLCGQKTIWNEAFLKCWCHLPVVSRPVYVAGFLSLWFVAPFWSLTGKACWGISESLTIHLRTRYSCLRLPWQEKTSYVRSPSIYTG